MVKLHIARYNMRRRGHCLNRFSGFLRLKKELTLKIKINKVGRIAEAIIEPKKFTIFMGRNDTGKTYAASTIWALIEFIKQVPKAKQILAGTSVGALVKSLGEQIQPGNHVSRVTQSELESIRQATLEYFNKNIKSTLEAAIGYDGFGASRVSLLDSTFNGELEIAIKLEEHPLFEEDSDDVAVGSKDEDQGEDVEDGIDLEETYWNFECAVRDASGEVVQFSTEAVPETIIQDFILDDVKERILGYACFGHDWNFYRNCIYVPAARTGIMLALNFFVEGAIGRTSRSIIDLSKEVAGGMPAPIQGFAANLVRPFYSNQGKSISSLSRLLRGELKRSKKRGLFLFSPEGSKAEIPLASASSLVTELAAISLMSRRFNRPTFLIFEEPEAHLHLEAQREMARSLAELVRNRVRVLVTTHSDTFIQQVNNLIALSDHPEKEDLLKRFSLSEEDLISRDSVCAYDFQCTNGVTEVAEIKLTKTGFVPESLNEVLRRLAVETLAINEALSDDEVPMGEFARK